MERAIAHIVDAGAAIGELVSHPGMQRADVLL
jgi:hypothetical protein